MKRDRVVERCLIDCVNIPHALLDKCLFGFPYMYPSPGVVTSLLLPAGLAAGCERPES